MIPRVSRMFVGRCAAVVFALACGAGAHAQLTPPPGPVAPSMKRLDQLDTRRVLNSLPGSQEAVHVISQPGQYFLTADVSCPSGKSAVLVTTTGDVSIELDGFSLIGAPGAISGVSMSSGSSLAIYGSKKGYDNYQARSSMSGFQAGVVTGITGGAVAGIVVASCTITDCGQGVVHLHAQNVVHRDLACRGMTGGDAISVQFDEPSSTPGGPRQTTSMDSSRCTVDGASGRGMHVASSSGTRLTITGSNFSNTGAQGLHVAASSGTLITVRGSSFQDTGSHGLHVARLGNPLVNEVTLPILDLRESSASGCGGAGLRLEGSSGLPTGRRMHARAQSFHVQGCVTGVEATDCDDLDCDDLSISNCSGDGVVCRQVGRPKFEDISITQLPARGMLFESCGDVSCVRVAIGDVDGDGVVCVGSVTGGGGAGKATFKEFTVTKREAGSGLATGRRGMVFTGLSLVECDSVTIADVDGDGVSASSCGKATFKEFTVTKKTDSASTASHGLHLTDCDDVSCVSVSVRGCSGDGIRHVATVSNAAGTRGRTLAHEAVHVAQCGGAGVRVQCPDQTCQCDVGFTGSSFSRCGAHGMVVLCPSSLCSVAVTCVRVQARDSFGNGMLVAGNPLSRISATMDSCEFTGNGGDGLAVRSSSSGTTLRGGGEVRCSSSHFSSNGGSGLVSENPLYADKSVCGENALYGARVVSDDPFKQIASLNDCVLARNGAACLSCPRGRFSTSDCRISDGLSHGIESSEGCALLTNTFVERCASRGITMSSSTLYMIGGAVRRNGGTGVHLSGGASFDVRDLTVELNGSSSPVGVSSGGISITDCPVVSMDRCVVSQNTGDGVDVSATIASTIDISVTRCKAVGNTGGGIKVNKCAGELCDLFSSGNGAVGILLGSESSRVSVLRCAMQDNAGGGLFVTGTRCVVQGNSATASSNATIPAIFIAPDNTACPIVFSQPGVPPSCSPTDNVVH